MNSNSWFFIVLLIIVIAYLSIKPESFKSFIEEFAEGIDISNSNTHNDISKNIIYTYDADDTESEKEDENEEETEEKTESSYSPYIEQKVKDWFNFDTYTTADFAFISIIFILFVIVLILSSKLTKL